MKIRPITCVAFATLLLLGCTRTPQGGPVVGRAAEGAPSSVPGGQLDDILARQPGITVDGRGPDARIHVAGADYPNPPLFVVDGLTVGYDFSRVWSQVPPGGVEAVRVIRATDSQAALYGVRGGNGVIEITLTRGP